MIYEIVHRTTYVYDSPVSASYGRVQQMPGDVDGQRAHDHRVTITPDPDAQHERVDFFGNRSATFVVHAEHDVLQVTSSCTVDTSGRPAVLPDHDVAWHAVRDRIWAPDASPADRLARDYALESPMIPALDGVAAYGAPSFAGDRPLSVVLAELVARVHADIAYEPGATTVDTRLDQVLAARRGVCQDQAHLLLGVLRSAGVPAAYVSGYIETDPPAGQARLQGADRTHAWSRPTSATGCGRASTRPTTRSRASATSPRRAAATTATCPR